jgi:hypothetical protein
MSSGIKPRERRGDFLGRPLHEQRPRQDQVVGGRLLGEHRILQHAFMIEPADFIRLGSCAPDGVNAGLIQQRFRTPISFGLHQQDAGIEPAMTAVIMVLDVHEVHRWAKGRMLVEVAHIGPQRWIVDQRAAIALEMAEIDWVEADERGEEADVGLGQPTADKIALRGKARLEPVERLKDRGGGGLIG